jgi:hypothetical protein
MIRQRGRVHNPKKHNRRIFLLVVNLPVWADTRGDQEAETWDASDLATMKVMDLNKRRFVPKRINLANILIFLDELLKNLFGLTFSRTTLSFSDCGFQD